MKTKFDSHGFLKNEHLRFFALEHKQGGGSWKEYDRITIVQHKGHGSIVWQIESRVFCCCGTTAFESLSTESDDLKYFQELLSIICEHMSYYPSPRLNYNNWGGWKPSFDNWPDAWFVDTREDIDYYKTKENNLISILFNKLGAKELIRVDNQVHSSSGLVLCSWNPKHCIKELEEYLFFTNENKTSWIPKYLEQEWKDEQFKNQASACTTSAAQSGNVVPVQAKAPKQQGDFVGAIGNGNVGLVLGAGIQQPQQNQGNQNRRHPDADRNPAK